ncbi:MAG: putative metal-dependent membrane protease [Halonotius sp. J07HN6]|nr:MAG: putative metal-dependent membrane protease [Halonotius sp. J07HN6]ERH05414.1 MAG: putative metal-dependent membrane protease [Halonotius sp. J07HN4]
MAEREQPRSGPETGDERLPVRVIAAAEETITRQFDGGDGQESGVLRLLGKVWAVIVAAGLGFGATLLSTALVLGLLFSFETFSITRPSSPLFELGVQFLLGQLLVMGGLSAAYLWATGNTIEYLDIHRPSLLQVAVVLVGPFVVFSINIAINLVGFAAGIQPAPNVLAEMVSGTPSLVFPLIPAMLLIVGPFEELLYRGVIQTRLTRSFTAPVAILVTSVIFALIHIPAVWGRTTATPSILVSLVGLLGGALVFGAIYEWTENLTVVALVHGLYNSMLLVLLYVRARYLDDLRRLAETTVVLGF